MGGRDGGPREKNPGFAASLDLHQHRPTCRYAQRMRPLRIGERGHFWSWLIRIRRSCDSDWAVARRAWRASFVPCGPRPWRSGCFGHARLDLRRREESSPVPAASRGISSARDVSEAFILLRPNSHDAPRRIAGTRGGDGRGSVGFQRSGDGSDLPDDLCGGLPLVASSSLLCGEYCTYLGWSVAAVSDWNRGSTTDASSMRPSPTETPPETAPRRPLRFAPAGLAARDGRRIFPKGPERALQSCSRPSSSHP